MRKLFLLLVAISLFIVPTSVFATDWPTEKQNDSRNAIVSSSDNPTLEIKSTLTTSLWQFEMPVYSDGVFYIAEKGQLGGFNVTASNRITGSTTWTFSRTSGILGSSPVVEGDYLIVPSASLILLNKKSGAVVWETLNFSNNLFFRYPIVIDNYIYVWNSNPYGSATILKFDLHTGAQITSFSLNQNSQGLFPITKIGTDLLATYSGSSNNTTVNRYSVDGALRWSFRLGGNVSGSAVVAGTKGIVSTLPGDTAIFDLETGALIHKFRLGASATIPIIDNEKAYFLTTSQFDTSKGGDTYINYYDLTDGSNGRIKQFDFFRIVASGGQIKIGANLYFGNSIGEIVKYSFDTGLTEHFMIENGGSLRSLMYADGVFVAMNSGKTKLYFTADINYSVTASSNIAIESPYRCSDCNQYLGQLHSHYKPDLAIWNQIWNGEPSPSFTVDKYKKIGYDFVALTEHNLVVPMPVTDGILQIQNAEESTQSWGKHHILSIGIEDHINENASDQERVNAVIAQGGIPIFAHPDSWTYGALTKTIANLNGLHHMEVYTHAISVLPTGLWEGSSFDDFDNLIGYYGKEYLITAADDFTPGNPGFDGGAVFVNAHSNAQSDIMQALKNGDFYAVQGSKAPRLSVVNSENTITVSSSEDSVFSFIGNGGKVLSKFEGVQATYTVRGNENYVRVDVKSKTTGKKSWTQALKINNTPTLTVESGNHIITLPNAVLVANATDSVSASVLGYANYPEAFPPTGYLSPVYSLSTAGNLNSGNSITISYGELNLPVNASKLSIYTFDETTQTWQKVPSTIDYVNKTVTAQLPHFSLYALSAEEVADTQAPIIGSIMPINLDSLNFDTVVSIGATDNQAVTSVVFGIDGNYVSTDSDGSDGWSTDLTIGNIVSGAHKLNVIAKDFVGNRTQTDFDFSVASTIASPTIAISSPAADSIVYNQSSVTGSFASDLTLDSIGIYMDDIFIGNASITDNSFSYEVDWTEIKNGDHNLKTVLTDVYGNKAVCEIPIKIDEEVMANIISPEAKNYVWSKSILVDVAVLPQAPQNLQILLDDQPIVNGSIIDPLTLSLGKHKIEVKQGEKLLDAREFNVVTNYEDAAGIVLGLYNTGHIKNLGTAVSIIGQFFIAHVFDNFGRESLEQKTLDHIEDYVDRLSSLKKPLIDCFACNIIKIIVLWL